MPKPHAPKPFVIGVAGGSGSGKSTVTRQVLAAVGEERVAVVMQDDYYRDQSHMPPEDRRKQNYDHPDAFDWDLMNQQLAALLAGQTIPLPVYDYADHNRSKDVVMVAPAPIVVFEGILALYDASLRDLFDLSVFVDTDPDVRLIRRLQRDVRDRGRTPDSIMNQYMTTVRPSHIQFIEPSKRYADVIIPEGGHNDRALDVLLARISSAIG